MRGPVSRAQSEAAGRRAEYLAAVYLILWGYWPIEHRWRSATGEIDLICKHIFGKFLFVEVKYRSSDYGGDVYLLESLIHPRQAARLQRTARSYLARHDPHSAREFSFDLVLVRPWRFPLRIRDFLR